MAFRDENGRITIDEAAARQDINNIGAAIESMDTVCRTLKQVDAQASDFSGGTGTAIQEVALRLAGEISAFMEQARETADTIEATVDKYQAIDQALKAAIEGCQ